MFIPIIFGIIFLGLAIYYLSYRNKRGNKK